MNTTNYVTSHYTIFSMLWFLPPYKILTHSSVLCPRSLSIMLFPQIGTQSSSKIWQQNYGFIYFNPHIFGKGYKSSELNHSKHSPNLICSQFLFQCDFVLLLPFLKIWSLSHFWRMIWFCTLTRHECILSFNSVFMSRSTSYRAKECLFCVFLHGISFFPLN